jgi:hypothetical protein
MENLEELIPDDIWTVVLQMLDSASLLMCYNTHSKLRGMIRHKIPMNKPFLPAIRNGCIAVIFWLEQLGPIPSYHAIRDSRFCDHAAAHNHQEMYIWLRTKRYRVSDKTLGAAARNGHLKLLQSMHTSEWKVDHHTAEQAAAGGQIEVLKWLRKINVKWSSQCCSFAALGGHFETLK